MTRNVFVDWWLILSVIASRTTKRALILALLRRRSADLALGDSLILSARGASGVTESVTRPSATVRPRMRIEALVITSEAEVASSDPSVSVARLDLRSAS